MQPTVYFFAPDGALWARNPSGESPLGSIELPNGARLWGDGDVLNQGPEHPTALAAAEAQGRVRGGILLGRPRTLRELAPGVGVGELRRLWTDLSEEEIRGAAGLARLAAPICQAPDPDWLGPHAVAVERWGRRTEDGSTAGGDIVVDWDARLWAQVPDAV